MSYRCEICLEAVEPGKSMLRHTVYRANKQVAREIPVCPGCYSALGCGVPLVALVAAERKRRAATLLVPAATYAALATPPPANVQPHPPTMPTPVKVAPTRPLILGKITHGPGNNGGGGAVAVKPRQPVPYCDICGADATTGQVTADTVLCKRCVDRARRDGGG